MTSIGFAGLGIMGKSMALNLLKNGYRLHVYNRTAEKTNALTNLGAEAAATPADLVRRSSVVITMLSNDEALHEVYYGEDGILKGIRPGQTIIDSSTASPSLSQQLHNELQSRSVHFLDAPVTGSKEAARDGTLTFMVGGDRSVMEEHLEIFIAMGKKTVYVGPSGSGAQLKLAHNTVVAVNTAAVCEGLSIAYKAGIEPDTFLEVLYGGGGNSRAAEMKGPKIVDRDFDTHFSLKLMLKDLKLAGNMGDQLGTVTPMLGAVRQLFQEAVNQNIGEEDMAALVKVYEQAIRMKIEARSVRERQPKTSGNGSGTTLLFGDRRSGERLSAHIDLKLSVYEWGKDESFSDQTFDGKLLDLSEHGLQVSSSYPLNKDTYIVIHCPKEAEMPPIIGKIIRAERHEEEYRYGCLLGGMPPVMRSRLEKFLNMNG